MRNQLRIRNYELGILNGSKLLLGFIGSCLNGSFKIYTQSSEAVVYVTARSGEQFGSRCICYGAFRRAVRKPLHTLRCVPVSSSEAVVYVTVSSGEQFGRHGTCYGAPRTVAKIQVYKVNYNKTSNIK